MANVLYKCLDKSKGKHNGANNDNLSRWERLLEDKDDTKVWKAIDWKEILGSSHCDDIDKPTDEEFKTH